MGFSRSDRIENVTRLGAYAETLRQEFDFRLIAVINPYQEAREMLRQRCCAKLIWLKCSIGVLITRDTKGLYKKALLPDGHPDKVYNLTGLNDTFETPASPDFILNIDLLTIEESLRFATDFIIGSQTS